MGGGTRTINNVESGALRSQNANLPLTTPADNTPTNSLSRQVQNAAGEEARSDLPSARGRNARSPSIPQTVQDRVNSDPDVIALQQRVDEAKNRNLATRVSRDPDVVALQQRLDETRARNQARGIFVTNDISDSQAPRTPKPVS